ncbi:MAG: hypothetical protein U5J78_01435 [Parasphingorhabdus sp.]|nr:hypothetical protein [Parasphingorhabdus sp.]
MAFANMAELGPLTAQDKPPQEAMLLFLTNDARAPKIKLAYTGVAVVPVCNGDTDSVLRGYLKGEIKLGKVKQYKPLTSPLDIRNPSDQFIIIILDDKVNWQFAANCAPFMIEKEAARDYVDARRVFADRKRRELVEVRGSTVQEGCRIGIFNAYGSRRSKKGSSVPFNLYVELLCGKAGKIPLVIDPGIGHPGGSGPG